MNNEQNNYVYINSNEVEFLEAYKTFIKGIYKLGDVNIKDGYFIFNRLGKETMTCEYIYYVKDIARVFSPKFTISNKHFSDVFNNCIKHNYVYELEDSNFTRKVFLREICSVEEFYQKEKYKYSIAQESFVK